MIVAHVVDRLDGGVPHAVASYIRNSPPSVDHHVISPFEAGLPHAVWRGVSAVHHDLGAGTIRRLAAVALLTKQIQPDVLHAHSSFPGVYARLARSRHTVRTVYTPHGYGFQRRDINPFSRIAFYVIEVALGANTSVIAACSPIEVQIARQMSTVSARVQYVPNVATIKPRTKPRTGRGTIRRFGILGRISAAKDPEHFIRVSAQIRAAFPDSTAVWIGGGDSADIDTLRRNGVHVTGWLGGDALVDEIDELDLYIHTSAWESFPLAVLDVHARRVPMLVRGIPAFVDIDKALTLEGGLDELLYRGADLDAVFDDICARWDAYLKNNHTDAQRDALALAWGVVT